MRYRKLNIGITLIIPFSLLLFAGAALHAEASETYGTIDAVSRYAWGENLGWINFHPQGGGLTITDSGISGYAWSEHSGWINFSPTHGGVTNDSSGQLGDYAWSSGLGWIDFSHVTISTTGKFTGIAGTASTTPGRINFDCTHCSVVTDWRPLSARTITPSVQGSITGSTAAAFALIPQDTLFAENIPLLIDPNKQGQLTQSTPVGPVIAQVPKNASPHPFTLSINVIPHTSIDLPLPFSDALPLNSVYYEINAFDADGRALHTFSVPITITLPLPRSLQFYRRLSVHWYDESNHEWVKIPDAIFSTNSVTFSVTHLTRFAIYATRADTLVSRPTVIQGPQGGAIVTEEKTVDITPQAMTVGRTDVTRNVRPAPSTATIKSGALTREDILILIFITFIAMLAHILARQRSAHKK